MNFKSYWEVVHMMAVYRVEKLGCREGHRLGESKLLPFYFTQPSLGITACSLCTFSFALRCLYELQIESIKSGPFLSET